VEYSAISHGFVPYHALLKLVGGGSPSCAIRHAPVALQVCQVRASSVFVGGGRSNAVPQSHESTEALDDAPKGCLLVIFKPKMS
jgi:hypothetical protein